jgi:hypothetical protein
MHSQMFLHYEGEQSLVPGVGFYWVGLLVLRGAQLRT